MKNIRIGTCVPGRNFAQWAPKLVQAGFECVTVNYHMEMEPEELAALPEIVKRALDGTSATISALGFSCNALENPEHERSCTPPSTRRAPSAQRSFPPLQALWKVRAWKRPCRASPDVWRAGFARRGWLA